MAKWSPGENWNYTPHLLDTINVPPKNTGILLAQLQAGVAKPAWLVQNEANEWRSISEYEDALLDSHGITEIQFNILKRMWLWFRESSLAWLRLMSIGTSTSNDHVVFLGKNDLQYRSDSSILIPKKWDDGKPRFSLEQISMDDTRLPRDANGEYPKMAPLELKIFFDNWTPREYLFTIKQSIMHNLQKNSQRSS